MEIERKYLPDTLPFDMTPYKKLIIKQGYISTSPTIRIRQSNDLFFLTVKGPGHMAREEFELSITKEAYENLSSKIEGNLIEKTRYIIPLDNNLRAEFDVYEGNLKGLLTVEVEFASMEECESFSPPCWFGREVTNENKYKNSNLSKLNKNFTVE